MQLRFRLLLCRIPYVLYTLYELDSNEGFVKAIKYPGQMHMAVTFKHCSRSDVITEVIMNEKIFIKAITGGQLHLCSLSSVGLVIRVLRYS